jgi:hypothetical protein
MGMEGWMDGEGRQILIRRSFWVAVILNCVFWERVGEWGVGIALEDLKRELPEGGLYGGGGWQWSPEPLRLSAAEADEICAMGYPLAKFQQACDGLYRRSAGGKVQPWLAELLDEGKPDWMVGLQREAGMVEQFPRVIRPDLILGKGHFSLTELDGVPGGICIRSVPICIRQSLCS